MWMEVAHSFQQGDTYLYLMLFFAFIGSVILFERLIMLQFIFNVDTGKFLTNLKKAIKAEDFDRAITICKSAGKTSLPLIGLRALEAAESDPSAVRGVIEEESIGFIPRIEARIAFLPMLATLILLAGVLGTINALWLAFHSVDVLDTAQKQAMIGHGVANSLSYSSFGLVIAMAILFFHQLLRGMAIRMTDRLNHGVTVLHNLLVPQEMAYMAVAPSVASATSHEAPVIHSTHSTQTVEAAPVAAAAQEAKEEDASFEEASVEDIKDEEEII